MSQFYAEIRGNRSIVSRVGSKKSGIYGHIRGWNLGVEVIGCTDGKGNDYFEVYRTSGSLGRKSKKLITTVKRI